MHNLPLSSIILLPTTVTYLGHVCKLGEIVKICSYLIRERHCGGVAPGFRVSHKNGVTVGKSVENWCVRLFTVRYFFVGLLRLACLN